MLSEENVEFEYDSLEHSSRVSRKEIVEAILKFTNKYIAELGIQCLEEVIVKPVNFFDTKLGVAIYKQKAIMLSKMVAVNLTDKNAILYNKALSVLKHELYHFRDYQNLLIAISENPSYGNRNAIEGFSCWTEFNATYMTFDILEDKDLYGSFKNVFGDLKSDMNDRRYYAARLLGYYFQKNHSEECELLVNQYLKKKPLDKIIVCFKDIMCKYPRLSVEQLTEVFEIMNEMVSLEVKKSQLVPLSNYALLRSVQNNRRGNDEE